MATAERRVIEADPVDEFDDPRGAQQGILAARHRGRAGVAFEAGQGHLVPALALPVRDDADVDLLVLEDRALFDVQFEEGMDRPPADRQVALEADPLQFVAERQPVAVR